MSQSGHTEGRGEGATRDSLDRKLQHNARMERRAARDGKAASKPEADKPSESQIDAAIEDSFPASDPPAHSSPTITPGDAPRRRSH